MITYLMLLETDEEKAYFQKIYEEYRNDMYYCARDILHNEQDAEDVVHEVFLILIEHLDKIIENDCHKTWNYIVTIVKNKSYNLYNRKKRRNTKVVENWDLEEVFAKDLYVEVEQREIQELLAELLSQMKSPFQEVLTLQFYHDMNAGEIAEILEKTPDNIRHISKRARDKLLRMLNERGIGDEYKG